MVELLQFKEGDEFGLRRAEISSDNLWKIWSGVNSSSDPFSGRGIGIKVAQAETGGAILASWSANGGEGLGSLGRAVAFPLVLLSILTREVGSSLRFAPDGMNYATSISAEDLSASEMRFDRVAQKHLKSKNAKYYACARTAIDIAIPLRLERGQEYLPFFGDTGRWQVRINPGEGSILGSPCGASIGFGGKACPFAGPPAFNLSVSQWQIAELESPGAWIGSEAARARAEVQLRALFPSAHEAAAVDSGELGYLFPPINCVPKNGRVFPVYRFRAPIEVGASEWVTIDVPAEEGMSSLESTWNCIAP